MSEYTKTRAFAIFSPKEKIIYSLQCAKFKHRRGRSLNYLISFAFGNTDKISRKETKRILYRMREKKLVYYIKENKTWCRY